MDWIKVKVKHAEYDFAHAPAEVFKSWIMMMIYVAATERTPTTQQLETRLGKENFKNLLSHMEQNGCNMETVIEKVLEDVKHIQSRREDGKLLMRKVRGEQHVSKHVNANMKPCETIREDKIREDKKILSPQAFLADLKTKPEYKHVNIDNELLKMDTWLARNPGRKKTPRFILRWLNKIEAPVGPTSTRRITA